MSNLRRTKKKPKIPTSYYAVVLSTMVHVKDGQFVAVVTDMPVREVGATRDEAITKAQRAALRMMADGEGPPYSANEDMAAAVAAASIDSVWGVVRGLMQSIDKRIESAKGST